MVFKIKMSRILYDDLETLRRAEEVKNMLEQIYGDKCQFVILGKNG